MHMKRIPFAVVWLACLVAGLLFGTPSRLTPDSFPIMASQVHAESARHTDSRREHSDRAGWHDHADNDHRRGGRGNHGRGRGWDRDHVYDRDKGSRGERRGRGKGHGGWHGHRPGGGHGGGGPDGDDGGNGSGDGSNNAGGDNNTGGGNDGTNDGGGDNNNPGNGNGGSNGNNGGDDGAAGGERPSGLPQAIADRAAARREGRGGGGSAANDFGPEAARAAIRASRRGSASDPFAAIATATGPLGWSAPQPASASDAPRIPLAVGDDAPSYRPLEITVLGLDRSARTTLRRLGFEVITEHRSGILGGRAVSRLRTPTEMSTEAALMLARQRLPGIAMDFTHLYRPAQDIQRASAPVQPVPVAYGAELVGLFGGTSCPITTSIGLIDTELARHPALADAPIQRRSFTNGGRTSVVHGTAIASMLVGDLPGALPLAGGAELYSASVFAFEDDALRSDVTAILAALDWMAERGVKVVNLSLMGPPNDLLQQGVMAAAERGQILLAAAGNSGPGAPPAYPAGYAPVIAVAAVDARGRPYLRNNRGDYITISAPGVDIWGADARGGEAFWTGTSFAVPFALASVARGVAGGQVRDVNDARAALARAARDLGAPGHDPIFGYGLLRMEECY